MLLDSYAFEHLPVRFTVRNKLRLQRSMSLSVQYGSCESFPVRVMHSMAISSCSFRGKVRYRFIALSCACQCNIDFILDDSLIDDLTLLYFC